MTKTKTLDSPLYLKEMTTPVGTLRLVASETAVVAILWEKEKAGRVKLARAIPKPNHPLLRETERQLKEYFAGRRTVFDLSLDPTGTVFQKRAWKALRRIPFGETRSYADQAKRIGSPKACRAVGAANGRNPISIVVPCHRVIGSDGSLTGFAGGENVKRTLLDLEKRIQS
jgi:methylated-DNA-[protein]-cysteine S-methyltransferase